MISRTLVTSVLGWIDNNIIINIGNKTKERREYIMNVYKCSKVSFSKNGITFYSEKFENDKEIKIDQPVSIIKTKMKKVLEEKNNEPIYLTYGMRDIDIMYDRVENAWQLFDGHDLYLFTIDL